MAKTLLSGVPCRYTGVDISNNMREIAKCKRPNENFIHGDIANMPYLESDSFDSVISLNGAFSHVLNYNDAINEFMRVIKPGGNLFIMVYSRFSFKRILNGSFIKTKGAYDIRNSSKNKKSTSPAHFWSVNKLRRAFSPFQNVDIRGLNLMVDVLNKHYEFHEAVSRLEREMTYPLFMQNFSHALVLKATKRKNSLSFLVFFNMSLISFLYIVDIHNPLLVAGYAFHCLFL